MKKKIIILTMIVALLIGICAISASAEEQVMVYIDGEKIEFDVPPQIIDGRTMVPMRKIFEELGATVDWNSDTQTATGIKGDITVKITVNDSTIYKNGEASTLDVPALLMDGRTLVPIRAVSEAFGVEVLWRDEIKVVSINQTERKSEDYTVMFNTYRETVFVENELVGLYLEIGWTKEIENETLKNKITKEKNGNLVYSARDNVLSIDNIFPGLYCSDASPVYGDGATEIPNYYYCFDVRARYIAEKYAGVYAFCLEEEGYQLICKMLNPYTTYFPTMVYELVTPDEKNLVKIIATRPQSSEDCANIEVVISEYKGESSYAYEEGYYNPQYLAKVYAADGSSAIISKDEVEAYLDEGWYAEPVMTLYTLEGESIVVKWAYAEDYVNAGLYTEPMQVLYAPGKSHIFTKKQVEEQLAVGWYTEPVVGMYNQDDVEIAVYPYEVEAYRAVGWFTFDEPVTIMYAKDGRTLYVRENEVEAYKAVGWYENIEDVAELLYFVTGPEYVLHSEVEQYLEEGWRRYSYPVIFADDACFEEGYADSIKLYWCPQNISGKRIIAYKITVYFLGREDDYLTDKYGNVICKTHSFRGPVYADEKLNINITAGYVNRCEEVVIGEVFLRFADGTTDEYWLGQRVSRGDVPSPIYTP